MTERTDQTYRLSVATWNMDYWKQSAGTRRSAWQFLEDRLGPDVALLQECVPPEHLRRSGRVVYRELAGNRPWGSAVIALRDGLTVDEIGAVRTRYASTRFHMLGTHPGTIIVTQVTMSDLEPVTCVSVYGAIDVYAQTTMHRIAADLIPLFDSPWGNRVILGGDFNVTTATAPNTPELPRYEAILEAVESLGLKNVAETAEEGPPAFVDCLCGDSCCSHIRTYGEEPGTQLDWLFASPALARRCRTLRVERDRSEGLSDHAPLVAEFDVPAHSPDREWDPASFLEEVGIRAGPEAAEVAEEIIAWAERTHEQLRRQGQSFARLDRLPTSRGKDPELWIQLDLTRPEALSYTVSMKADGRLVVQFQHMKRSPFDSDEGKRRLWTALNEMEGVQLEERLNGRPSFPMRLLAQSDNLGRFLRILEDAVDEIVQAHAARDEVREEGLTEDGGGP